MTEKSIAQRVEEIIAACILTENESLPESQTRADAIVVEGIVHTFFFERHRLQKRVKEIAELISLMDPVFFKRVSGGASFLMLCVAEDGHQWGEHRDCEALCALAIAAELGEWVVPRALWRSLPGGMPYIAFNLPVEAAAA